MTIFIKNINDFKLLKLHDSFSYMCKCCGKICTINDFRSYRINQYSKFLCYKCFHKTNWHVKKDHILSERKKTCLDKYGDPNFTNRKLANETTERQYGNKNYRNPEKSKITKAKNHDGDATYNNREKARKTCFDKYGVEFPSQSQEIKEKQKSYAKNNNGRYSPNEHYNYYGIQFDSSWELAVWIYCIDHNIPIIREPCSFDYNDIYNEPKTYTPDLMINGKLVEIKGNHYFKSDGTIYYPYKTKPSYLNGKRIWVKMTPKEKEYMDDKYYRRQKCGLANGVEFWKEEDCVFYTRYCKTKFNNKYWYRMFLTNNPLNPSYWCITNNAGYYNLPYFAPYLINTMNNGKGATSFDIKKGQKYAPITGKGLTPFDI